MSVGTVRTLSISGASVRLGLIAAALLATAACADAPITAADLQADGQLRERSSSQQSVHAASESNRPKAQRAQQLQVTGLLATQADGPLEDATRFSTEAESIYLHLRAEHISEPRPVTYVWRRGDEQRETMGFLRPSDTLSLAASLPLARYVTEATEAAEAAAKLPPTVVDDVVDQPEPFSPIGEWTVEVYSTDQNGRNLVFERSFEVAELEEGLPDDAAMAGAP